MRPIRGAVFHKRAVVKLENLQKDATTILEPLHGHNKRTKGPGSWCKLRAISKENETTVKQLSNKHGQYTVKLKN